MTLDRASTAVAALGVALSLSSSGCGDCTWPGEGWLTYTTRRAGQYDIRAVRSDGTCDRPIADSSDDEIDSSLSAATHQIVHWAWREGRGRIVVHDVFSGVERALDLGELVVGSPAVSPDGQWIAFEGTTPPARAEIYVVPVRGGTPTVLASSTSTEAGPAWSADGGTLYFGSNRSGRYQIWRVNVDGTGLEQVTTDATSALTCGAAACGINGRPSPSPDGKTVAFTRVTPGSLSRVIVRDLVTGEERVLADATDAEPSFSPSGTEIAVMNVSFGDPEVVVRDAATGLLLGRLTDSSGLDGAPSFAR